MSLIKWVSGAFFQTNIFLFKHESLSVSSHPPFTFSASWSEKSILLMLFQSQIFLVWWNIFVILLIVAGGKPWNNVGKAETAINVSAWVPPPLSSSLLLSTSDSRDAKLTEVSSASPPTLQCRQQAPHNTTCKLVSGGEGGGMWVKIGNLTEPSWRLINFHHSCIALDERNFNVWFT